MKSEDLWHRVIALVDMNAFFASVEQRDRPELKNKPVVVLPGLHGRTVIASSYEARGWGIYTGTSLIEAKQRCPDLHCVIARHARYKDVSSKIMCLLQEQFSPIVEIASIDEAYLDLTQVQRCLGHPALIGERIQKALMSDAIGLPASIGISGDKTTAKLLAKRHRPSGIGVLHPSKARSYLAFLPVQELCGVGPGLARYLAERGVIYCKDMASLPVSELTRRFGGIGARIWSMCQGLDPQEVNPVVNMPKTIGRGKMLPYIRLSTSEVKAYFSLMCAKVSWALREQGLFSEQFLVAFKDESRIWTKTILSFHPAINQEQPLFKALLAWFDKVFHDENIIQIQVTAISLCSKKQGCLLDHASLANNTKIIPPYTPVVAKNEALSKALDHCRKTFGSQAIMPACRLPYRHRHDV